MYSMQFSFAEKFKSFFVVLAPPIKLLGLLTGLGAALGLILVCLCRETKLSLLVLLRSSQLGCLLPG